MPFLKAALGTLDRIINCLMKSNTTPSPLSLIGKRELLVCVKRILVVSDRFGNLSLK